MKQLIASISNPNHKYLIAIILIPILANAPVVTGIVNCDPEIATSGLGEVISRWPFLGNDCFIDPTVGQLTQPLGYVSAQDWLHFIVPWWNPYLGVGMPMAAEMQTESFFFPFILLLHFHSGWLLQKLAFEILTGLFSYAFLVKFGLARGAALVGAALFSLNGTFVLTPHAAIAPIFFLPLLLLGLENAFHAAQSRRPMAWSLVAAAIAGSIYAGFPEVAFFDGLLAFVWAAYRLFCLPKDKRFHFGGKVAAGGVIGAMLTAPLTSAFLQYLAQADIGAHANFYRTNILSISAAPLQIFPLFYGAICAGTPDALVADFQNMWVCIGGWFGTAPVLLMLLSICRTSGRNTARYVMFAWVILWEARYFGFPGSITLVNLVPGIAATDAVRFSPVSVEFAVFFLAACGFDDLLRQHKYAKPEIAIWLILSICVAAASILPAIKFYPIWFHTYPTLRVIVADYFAALLATSIILIATILYGRFKTWLGILVVAESMAIFIFSQSGGPHIARVNPNGLQVLDVQKNFGRIYTTGVFTPDYPAAYNMASINYEQLPVPKIWTDYIKSSLFANADTIAFAGAYASSQPGQDLAILTHFSSYEALGIRYVITPPEDKLFSTQDNPIAQQSFNAYIQISKAHDFENTLRPREWPNNSITHVSIVVGTDFGISTGMLQIKLCSADNCVNGQAPLSAAADNQPLTIALEHPLTIQTGEPLSYRFSLQGNFVSLWLPPTLDNGNGSIDIPAGDPSALVFGKSYLVPSIERVYHDDRMDIYKIPDPAPYAETADASCDLTVFSRQKMNANCAHATTLERRELFYPGWRAQVNGADVPITRTDEIFQRISLPAGPAKIRFTYMPPYTPLACVCMIIAAALWAAAATVKFWAGRLLSSIQYLKTKKSLLAALIIKTDRAISETRPLWRIIAFILAVIMAAIVEISHEPGHLLHPELFAEDGPFWLGNAYDFGLKTLGIPVAGYLQTLPRLVALVALIFPLTSVPRTFVLASLFIELLPVLLILSDRGGVLITSYVARFLLVAFYLCAPNSFEVYINLTNAMWNLALGAFIVLVLPKPKTIFFKVFDGVIIVISSLSGPFGIFNAVVGWWTVLGGDKKTRRANLLYAGLTSVGALVQLVVILVNQSARPHGLGATTNRFIHIFLNQIIFGGVIGGHLVGELTANTWWADFFPAAVVFVIAVSFGLIAFINGPSAYRKFVFLCTAIFLGALSSPEVTSAPQWLAMQNPGAGDRYYVMPILCWFTTLMILSVKQWYVIPDRIGHWVARLIIIASCLGIFYDWHYNPYNKTNFHSVAKQFEKAPAGATFIIPVSTDSWSFPMTKH